MLGTGTPNADPERSGPAVAIVVDDRSYIVDCGPGVVRRAAAAADMHNLSALRAAQLQRVFITHLHSDHTLGCPDLLLSPWVLNRGRPRDVWGPEGTANMFFHIGEAFREDINMRIYGLEPRDALGYRSNVTEIAAGVIFEDDLVKVTAIPVVPGTWPQAYAYRFDTPDRSIVISGDADLSENLVDACNGCDVLIHEVISEQGLSGRTPDWQAYHRSYHTTSVELGELATRARPGLLILYHQLFSGATDEVMVEEVRRGFSGRIVSAKDLQIF
jgi:ribonuclease BN (tRNA processing enzyme)